MLPPVPSWSSLGGGSMGAGALHLLPVQDSRAGREEALVPEGPFQQGLSLPCLSFCICERGHCMVVKSS